MKQLILLVSLISILLMIGCKKSLLTESAPNIIVGDNLYVNKDGFETGLNGLYQQVRRSRAGHVNGTTQNLMLLHTQIGTDNGYNVYEATLEGVFNNWGARNNAELTHYRLVWAWLYETINAANTIINRAGTATFLSAAEKNGILAEARFIRAWCYRHLTYGWGDVPLTLVESSGSTIKTDWQRTPVALVRDSMMSDLLFAEQYLLELNAGNSGKVLKGAAQHYLAELYLTQNKYAEAKAVALKVTQNPAYRLVTARYGVNATKPGTPFTDLFLDGNSNRSEGNTEALWVLQNEFNVSGGEGENIMRRYWVNRNYSISVGGKFPIQVDADNGGRGTGRLGPTKFALSLYEPGDDRGSNHAWRFYWIINNPNGIPAGRKLGDTLLLDRTSNEKINNPNWPNTRKWDWNLPTDPAIERQYNDQAYVRSVDTYLLLAEAYFRLNDLANAAATLNTVRTRAKASAITASQVTLDFILDERSRELFSEEERRYTLLRTGKWLERVRLHNKVATSFVTTRDQLLPIPQTVISANLTAPMPQNPGY